MGQHGQVASNLESELQVILNRMLTLHRGRRIRRLLPPDRRRQPLGDPTKAKAKLGWNPQTTTFEQLVELMVKHDMAKVAADNAASDVRKMNLAEYIEKRIVK